MSSQNHSDRAPRPSPQTDPTNPHRQESTGEWVSAEGASERHADEVGLTDRDRAERDTTSPADASG